MRKTLAALLGAAMVITLGACSTPGASGTAPGTAAGKTIYVLGPTPDHGWTAQAGTYAEAKVEEINAGRQVQGRVPGILRRRSAERPRPEHHRQR